MYAAFLLICCMFQWVKTSHIYTVDFHLHLLASPGTAVAAVMKKADGTQLQTVCQNSTLFHNNNKHCYSAVFYLGIS